MKIKNILAFATLGTLLWGCDSEKEFKVIDEELPLKASALYLVGDAASCGWDIDNPLPFVQEDTYIFSLETRLFPGRFQVTTTTGTWDVPLVLPATDVAEDCTLSDQAPYSAPFIYERGKTTYGWNVAVGGIYRIVFNLKTYTVTADYLGAPPAEPKAPIDVQQLFMVGDAAPCDWNIGSPTPLTKQSQYVYTYEGALKTGELKVCAEAGSWDVPFIRPESGDVTISDQGVSTPAFMYEANPDFKWKVTVAGNYRLSFDLQLYTITAEYLGEPEKPGSKPLEAENFYIVGDAAPTQWDINNPTALTKQSQYVFTYEGRLFAGTFQGTITAGTWDVPLVLPADNDNCTLSDQGAYSSTFIYETGKTQDKWYVATDGMYRLTFNLEHYTVTAEYLGAPEVKPLVPIETETVYMVGDAAPCDWNIDAPTPLTKQSQYIFTYEGPLKSGYFKMYTVTGDWGAPSIRPQSDGVEISTKGVADPSFMYETAPDNKWHVTEGGNYRLTVDLEHYTISAEAM